MPKETITAVTPELSKDTLITLAEPEPKVADKFLTKDELVALPMDANDLVMAFNETAIGWLCGVQDDYYYDNKEEKAVKKSASWMLTYYNQKHSDVKFRVIKSKDVSGVAQIKFPITHLLSDAVIQLLVVAPTNPQVRALVLQAVGKPIPDELVAYNPIKVWLETQCAPFVDEAQAQSTPRRQRQRRSAFTVECDFSETERGRCRYRRSHTGSGGLNIMEDMLAEWLEEADDFEDLVEKVKQHIYDDAYAVISPDMEVVPDSESYDQYDTDDGDGIEVDFSRDRLVSVIKRWIESNASDDDRNRMGL